jgi:outer membrane protein TolC
VAASRPFAAIVAAACVAVSMAAPCPAQAPLTLEEALKEAHAANARLPLPALDVSMARERQTEARAERWLKVAVEGDFVYAPAWGYSPVITNLGEARFQAVVRQPIYAGGSLRAGVERARAGVEAAGARFRMAEKDLDLEVRGRFSELLAVDSEIATRRDGIDRLETYRESLRSRQAAGQGVSADLLKTDVRISLETTTLGEAEQRREEIRLSLNELMGRAPTEPLEVADLPAPQPPGSADELAWQNAPEIAAAEAESRAAAADLTIARAERRPHLFARADTGFWTADTTHLGTPFWDRLWGDGGYSLSLALVWPVWDTGAARARVAQADIGLQQARIRLEVERRGARLAFEQARAAVARIYAQIQTLSRAVPEARDSYLATESRYRGGAASALEVLDAYAASVEASVRLADAVARYRVAQAAALRWGTP